MKRAHKVDSRAFRIPELLGIFCNRVLQKTGLFENFWSLLIVATL